MTPSIEKISAVTLRVRNMTESVRFYRDVLDKPLARVVLKLGPREGILIPSVKDDATGKPISDFWVLATVRDPNSSWQISAGFSPWTTRTPIPAGRDVTLEVSAHGYKKWVYAEPLHMQPGERKTLSIELQPEEKHAPTTH